MCWSFEVSVTAGTLAYVTTAYLWQRNATPRDRWNAIFLGVFSTMQWIDASIWYLHKFKGEKLGFPCSQQAQMVVLVGIMVIILEPVACLVGSMYARRKWWTRWEFLLYVVGNLTFEFIFGYITPFIYNTSSFCEKTTCPFLTPNGHLLLSFGIDENGEPKCWREYGFFGDPAYEIPLWLRVAFLTGMVYPYMVYMVPTGSGLIQSFVLIATWFVGFMSDSHASVWCLANVAQVFTMIADPYWFPPKPEPMSSPVQHRNVKEMARDLYNKRKVQKAFDYIVIGSGIGGLTTAALLSRAGFRVLVLEQHYRAGGCTHEFTHKNNSFDSGIHYVGGSRKMKAMLSFITDSPGVALAKMGSEKDGYLYDEFDLGKGPGEDSNLIVRFRAGKQKLREELETKFPHEKEGIQKYFDQVAAAQHSFYSLALLKIVPDWVLEYTSVRNYLLRMLHAQAMQTATDVVEQCVKDPKLRALLSAGQLIDWNLQPNKCSWTVVGGMASYYADGGFYPVGGSRTIAERIIPVIERSGGRVLCRAKVSDILLDEESGMTQGQATGVRLTNGDEIFARHGVVSDIGIVNTFNALPDSAFKASGLSREIPNCPPMSNGHMTAFITLDGPPQTFDLKAANIHSWTALPDFGYDPNRMQEAFYADPFSQKEGCLVTLTAPCVKDPTYRSEHPDTANVLLLTEAKWEWFKDMDLEEVKQYYKSQEGEGKGHGKRPDEYLEFKKKWETIFLERMYQYYPKTKGHVVSIEIGTPVTEAHFIGSPKGGSYGLAWSIEHFKEDILLDTLRVKSKIPGLFITGESALFGGFAGAMAGGYISAFKVLGLWRFLKVLLCTEAEDADKDHVPILHPEVTLDEEPTGTVLLGALLGVFGFMLGGRRFGKVFAIRALGAKFV